ncbi:unnamed protein product [Ambrosiozyma monospora]|uniref:Unnamed protein product n=1 Tax=Ambrosiozyma monospora TaxID=43982 RepID=A0A9W6T2H6_AMBMO|nr:unnamed protein product [Ambrosiozyma monospora]
MNVKCFRCYKRTVQTEDFYLLDERDSIDFMFTRFQYFFKPRYKELQQLHISEKCQSRGETIETSSVEPSEDLQDFQISVWQFLVILFKTFSFQITLGTTLIMLYSCSLSCIPILQKQLIAFVEQRTSGKNYSIGKGIGYAIGVAVLIFANGIIATHGYYQTSVIGAKLRALLIKVLLDKSFKMDARGHHDFPDGKINSIMSTDLNRIDYACIFAPFVIASPCSFAIALAMLIYNIGVSALVGVAVFTLATVMLGF